MKAPEIISAKASLDGVKQLFLIVIGLGITEALTHCRDLPPDPWAWLGYLVLLVGYLLTVFRIALGIINILDHVSSKLTAEWTQSMSLSSLGFLSMALCLFGMGTNLQHPLIACGFLAGTLFCHNASLFVCHKPWAPPRGWGQWIVAKSVAILLNYPGHWYDPQKDSRHYEAMSEEHLQIKRTHYFWMRTNGWLWLGMLWVLGSAFQSTSQGASLPPDTIQTGLGVTLIGLTAIDFILNRNYYFGAPPVDAPSEVTY